MEQKNKIPFPQANDFDKIMKIIHIEHEESLNDKKFMLGYLDVSTERQIAYYLSAVQFLDIIDVNKAFTSFGNDLRKSSYDSKIIKISRAIVSKPVFGEVFFYKYYFLKSMGRDDISQLISTLYNVKNQNVCYRRASTVEKWIDWIDSNVF